MSKPGAWAELFPHALRLMAHLERQTRHALWTFGGGTVLMLRIGHRQSKDIDLFVPDPQYLGYVNPRLSDVAEQITADYEENGTALTTRPFDVVSFGGREIKVETSAEIIAKKMWHRGDRANARDLYDLCAVAEAEPEAITLAAPFFKRHGTLFLQRLHERATWLQAEFAAIDAIGFRRPFAQCLTQAQLIVEPLLTRPPT